LNELEIVWLARCRIGRDDDLSGPLVIIDARVIVEGSAERC